MNGRILELAKNPELFQIKDLELLNSEINKHPYIQSLRALHLLGTHRLKPENYANELSITAAYTTDKKILYQLINSTKENKPSENTVVEPIVTDEILIEEPLNKFTEIESKVVETPKAVYVNGELNRILFEGEEDFLEREDEVIDLESTIESGTIVTQKIDGAINPTDKEKFHESKAAETFSTETIIKQEFIADDTEIIKNPADLSFHEVAEILPEVEIKANVENLENQDFKEAKDAENFSKETIIKEEIIAEEDSIIDDPSKLSFHATEEFLPEVEIEANVENLEAEESQGFKEVKHAETFSKETIIKEEIIAEEEPLIEDPSKLSFHATAEFLPEVKIAPSPEKAEIQEIAKPSFNKHEEEMQRLIAEVEAKMKASKTQKKTAEEKEVAPKSAEINFSETQSFEVIETEEKEIETVEKENAVEEPVVQEVEEIAAIVEIPEVQQQDISSQTMDAKDDSVAEIKPAWQPMSFSSNTPDALISKKQEQIPVKKEEVKVEKIIINKEEETKSAEQETQSTDRPIFNGSFFTENVTSINKEDKNVTVQKEERVAESTEDSNVPTFINTWQSWLKIDRTKEVTKEKIEISITEIKNKVIENFIEKEPRISKLKEESDFVIKERNDDISHLMTETLANLYTEQKLYAKAIKSYGLLSEKHPGKKTYFDDKIKEIKELRQNK
ncbi:hypothetical protein [Kaistella antarctica]|uniref:Tetratricopeptide repeat protein n=1 Tax=Kaistella antarctica TaxID=266748 RepID=A0A3S4UZH1_9FLAO|nr:hypothetical protein [Kaistella antarctica]KEY18158.1 hypothetical protein HY04_06450 [Kaistella antarctica]SEV83193.1 hypothetical protein SAMN05421765_0496 [Kaistella antarctica]VEI00750.1 Uncharacterised protein [Kaistella antarctica]